MFRRLTLLALSGTVAALGVVGTAGPAYADTLTCSSGTGSATISPGLTTTDSPNDVVSVTKLKGCSGANGLVKGKVTAHIHLPAGNCLPHPSGTVDGTGTFTAKWKNSSGVVVGNSSGNITLTSNGMAAQGIATTNTTAGLFVGDTSTTTFHYTITHGACSPTNPTTAVSTTNGALTSTT